MKSFFSFEWLSDYIWNLLNTLEKKDSIGKLCYYFLILFGALVSISGLFGLFALNYGFIEFIGIHDGILMVLGVFILPVTLAYILSKKPWFWVLDFIVGILTIILIIINV